MAATTITAAAKVKADCGPGSIIIRPLIVDREWPGLDHRAGATVDLKVEAAAVVVARGHVGRCPSDFDGVKFMPALIVEGMLDAKFGQAFGGPAQRWRRGLILVGAMLVLRGRLGNRIAIFG